MNNTQAVNHEQTIPDVLRSLVAVHTVMDTYGLDRTIHHLVQLRASQINRCGFCISMHMREARGDGETEARLEQLIAWPQTGDFSARERAALAWTEALTTLNTDTDLAVLRGRLREYFTEREIGILTTTVAMINLWNRINISRH